MATMTTAWTQRSCWASGPSPAVVERAEHRGGERGGEDPAGDLVHAGRAPCGHVRQRPEERGERRERDDLPDVLHGGDATERREQRVGQGPRSRPSGAASRSPGKVMRTISPTVMKIAEGDGDRRLDHAFRSPVWTTAHTTSRPVTPTTRAVPRHSSMRRGTSTVDVIGHAPGRPRRRPSDRRGRGRAGSRCPSSGGSRVVETHGSRCSACTSASTMIGSNCVPRHRSISPTASSRSTGSAVGPGRRHGVEGVGHGDDPGELRDLLAAQPGRVAQAVDALVVVEDPLEGLVEELDVLEHLGAAQRVRLDHRELVVGEAARLLQDLRGHAELADVVEDPGVAQGVDPVLADAQDARDHHRCLGDPLAVTAGVVVLGLHGLDEGPDGGLVRLLLVGVLEERPARDEQGEQDQHGGEGADADPQHRYEQTEHPVARRTTARSARLPRRRRRAGWFRTRTRGSPRAGQH